LNFKDVYKSANDSIHADRNLIEDIYAKAESKKGFFASNYRQLSICAAGIILVAAIGALPSFYKPDDNKAQNPIISNKTSSESLMMRKDDKVSEGKKDTGEKTAETDFDKSDIKIKSKDVKLTEDKDENVVYNEERSEDKDNNREYKVLNRDIKKFGFSEKNKNHEKKTDSDSEITAEKNNNSESATKNSVNDSGTDKKPIVDDSDKLPEDYETDREELNTESYVEDIEKTYQTADYSKIYNEYKDENSLTYKAGGGGGGSARVSGGGSGGGAASAAPESKNYTSSAASVLKEMSSGEYMNYLGIDLFKIARQLPKGMNMNIPEFISVSVENGTDTYIYDEAQFVILYDSEPSKIVSISTTKLNGDSKYNFERIPSSHKKSVNNTSVAFEISDSGNKAYFQHKGVWMSVVSYDVLEKDFYELINLILINI